MKIEEIQNTKLKEACREFGVSKLYIFGSFAEGSSTVSSDIDFLVEFNRSGYTGAFDQFIGLKNRLEEIFEKPVDLLTMKKFRNPVFLEEIDKSKSLVYAA
ncbi:MAG: nucleotidyltransferase domain-containing protein [Gracilimonas sp.]